MCKVSIILPVKNAEAYLLRAIQSIQDQSYSDWELIVVNDGSEDSSTAMVEGLAQNDSQIRLIHNPSRGIAHALNYGISQARGAYLTRMDAYDISHPDRIAAQLDFLDNHPEIGLIGTQVNFLGDRDQHAGYAAYVDWTNGLISPSRIRANRFVESPFAHPSVMFRKSLVTSETEPYRQGNFPEDYELWLRWMDQGVQMAKLESRLLDWSDPPERLSRTDPRYSPESFYQTKARYLAKWLQQEGHTERSIWIWGAGRITRKRARFLAEAGIPFSGYLDIDPRKTGVKLKDIPVLHPDDLDFSRNPFIVSYVGSRGARDKIRSYLLAKECREERDFILAA